MKHMLFFRRKIMNFKHYTLLCYLLTSNSNSFVLLEKSDMTFFKTCLRYWVNFFRDNLNSLIVPFNNNKKKKSEEEEFYFS